MMDCLAKCGETDGCESVAFDNGDCYLKSKRYGDKVLKMDGVYSRNLDCGGEWLLDQSGIVRSLARAAWSSENCCKKKTLPLLNCLKQKNSRLPRISKARSWRREVEHSA